MRPPFWLARARARCERKKADRAGCVKRTGGQALVAQLEREGVRDLFALPGVQLDWAFAALAEREQALRVLVPRHEQAVTYMADGYARAGGGVGVAMAVPGPGVLNALAGLATAYACNSRIVMLAGQLPLARIGQGRGMLHELPDQSGILQRLAKWHALAREPGEVAALLAQGVRESASGRPRPAVLELPQDVLQREAEAELASRMLPRIAAPAERDIERVLRILRQARFPVLVAGGGVLAAGAAAALSRFAERLGAPVLVTENGTGAMDSRHPLALPWLGARAMLPHADAVLAVGTRFCESTGSPPATPPGVPVILVNADAADLGAPRSPALAIEGDARLALEALDAGLGAAAPGQGERAVAAVRAWIQAQLADIAPQCEWLAAIRAAVPEDGILIPDLTQVGYPAALAYPVYAPGTFLTPGYQGTLGFAYATALGAAAANPGRAVVSLSGDGGFGWTLQELATAKRYRLGVCALVFRDGAFGNVRLLLERQFGRAYCAELENPDFVRLAEAFGVSAERVADAAGLRDALRSAIASRAPALIEVPVGRFPSPRHLIRNSMAGGTKPPPNPLGDPRKPGAGADTAHLPRREG